jgi:hypothetical protein
MRPRELQSFEKVYMSLVSVVHKEMKLVDYFTQVKSRNEACNTDYTFNAN